MECIFLMFLDHTQRRSTFGRTPLDERSARRRDLYLTTDKYPCPWWESNPRSEQVNGRRPLTCWDCGFDSPQGHGYLSVVSVVCCQVEVSTTCWSHVQRTPTEYDVSCVIYKHQEYALYIYDISSLKVNNLTLILLTWRKWWANNASK
jgi:hypothetical protein